MDTKSPPKVFNVEGYGTHIPETNAVFTYLAQADRATLHAMKVGESDHLYFTASGQSTQSKVERVS